MVHSTRRNFITTVAALAGSTIIPNLIHSQPATRKTTWDLSWLDDLKGKHRQVFDMGDFTQLGVVRNWLDAHQEVFGLRYPDVNAVVGIGGSAFPVNASHDLYKKYPIGEHWKVTDPETQKPAMRNIFFEGGKTPSDQDKTVSALRARGVIFWQCNKALHKIAKELSEIVKQPEADAYTELKAGLNPNVILVPAHTMLLGLAQEHGCTSETL